MNEGQEFLKYATKHVGLNSMHVGHFIESSMTPYIIEERPMNMTQMDVFSRLMMDRIIFLGTGINDQVAHGTYEVMKIYMNPINHIDNILLNIGVFHAELINKENLLLHNVPIQRTSFDYEIIRGGHSIYINPR